MTDPTASNPASTTPPASTSPPAGWYADPAGSSDRRYWDGTRWTDQLQSSAPASETSATATPAPAATPAATTTTAAASVPATPSAPGAYRPQSTTTLPPDTRVDTPWIWALALLPLLSIIAFAAFDLRGYLVDSVNMALADPSSGVPQFPSLGGVLLVGFVGLLVTAGTIVFAFLDWRALKSRGVVRPFHWAWSLFALAGSALGALVYLIGRSVIVFRQSRRGLAPLWVLLGLFVLSLIVIVAKYVDALSVLNGMLPGFDRFS